MTEMISCCGLRCDQCGAYLATRNDDDEKRAEVADTWSKMYKADIKPEHVNCDGCRQEGGRQFSYCAVCGIRSCAYEKGVENCGRCPEYACDIIEKFFEMVPNARTLLDEIYASNQG